MPGLAVNIGRFQYQSSTRFGPIKSGCAASPNRETLIDLGILFGFTGTWVLGKSNIAVNLVIKLAQMRRRVVLLDADLGTANANVLCNLYTDNNLAQVVAGRRTLKQALVDGPGGFRLVPGHPGWRKWQR